MLEPARLPKWLQREPQAVVGATVHALLKSYDALPEFDLVVIDEASQVRVPESSVPISLVGRSRPLGAGGRSPAVAAHRQGRLPGAAAGSTRAAPFDLRSRGQRPRDRLPACHVLLPQLRSLTEPRVRQAEAYPTGTDQAWRDAPNRHFVARRCGPAPYAITGPAVMQLTENFRMNDVLTSFSAGLLYGPNYRPYDAPIAARRLDLVPERCLDPFVEACLDPAFPLVVVVLDGVWAARENAFEARLVAKLVTGLRGTLRGAGGKLYADDEQFFRSGVFLISPHRAQIRLIDRELRQQRMWQHPPLVDTVDKMQGQEADAVIVSYGVSDPEFAIQEAEFIYGLNRLNVAVTRARSKCVVFLPRPLLEAAPQVLDRPQAMRGMAFMRDLVAAVSRCGEPQTFALDDGASAVVYRTATAFGPAAPVPEASFDDEARLRELVDEEDVSPTPAAAQGSGNRGS